MVGKYRYQSGPDTIKRLEFSGAEIEQHYDAIGSQASMWEDM